MPTQTHNTAYNVGSYTLKKMWLLQQQKRHNVKVTFLSSVSFVVSLFPQISSKVKIFLSPSTAPLTFLKNPSLYSNSRRNLCCKNHRKFTAPGPQNTPI